MTFYRPLARAVGKRSAVFQPEQRPVGVRGNIRVMEAQTGATQSTRRRNVMNKSLIALATALVAATTMFASTAEAGFGIRIGFGPIGFASHGGYGASEPTYRKREYRAVRRQERQEKVRVSKAKKATETATVEKAEATPAPVAETTTAESENSSISVAAVEQVEAPQAAEPTTAKTVEKPVTTAAAQTTTIGCKKFFASVGLTLSVPCE
jgi:hypothetical protein